MIVLEGEGESYTWRATLGHIAALEQAYGSLYVLGENLLTQSVTLSAVAGAVKMLYRQAGCTREDAALDEFILRQPCTHILVAALLDILGPIEKQAPGGPQAAFLHEMMKRFPDTEKT